MEKDDCSCKAKGRLFVHIESDCVRQIKIMIMEEHGYRDYYTVFLHGGKGDMRIDNIAFGKVTLTSNIDSEHTIYYPDHIILFQKNDFIKKINIVDRRKKIDEL